MCGFAGLVALGRRPVSSGPLQAMTAALAHRGPDGEGFWTAQDGRAALGHRRLAVIDLDARAGQPMGNENGTVVVAFNGEIYNHRGLRQTLLAAGHRFATGSADTEVLVHGFEEWGIDGLLARLEGIYSFAVVDSTRRTVHLARDPMGIKPLYLAWAGEGDGETLLFASELQAILAHGDLPARPAWSQLGSYLTFMAVPAPFTMAEGVFKIPAGHRVEIDESGRSKLVRFFEPVAAALLPPPASFGAAVTALRAHLERAVQAQMIADVPVGVLLSGGIDSTAILALAAREQGRLDGYTVRFTDDAASDETGEAAGIARRYGARHHVYDLSPAAAIDSVDAVIEAQDEPQADWVCLPLWFLSREVAHQGRKVVLVGEGADEQFAGYDHWRPYLGRIADLGRRIRPFGRLAVFGAEIARRLAPSDLRWLTRLDFVSRAAKGGETFWGGAILAWPAVRDAILPSSPDATPRVLPRWSEDAPDALSAEGADDAEALVGRWYAVGDAATPGLAPLDRMIAAEFRHRLPELLLMRVDKMTMAHGVEARVPFLDRDLVAFSFGLPAAMKLEGPMPKWLLREAVADLLPDSLRLAPKRGFGAPVDRWLRGPFGDLVRETIRSGPLASAVNLPLVDRLMREHRAGLRNHAGLLWALHVMSRWISLTFGPKP